MITYEWTLETIVDDEIADSDFSDTLTFNKEDLSGNDLGLVRNEGNEANGITDRYWAYIKDGKLPEYFSDSQGEINIKVPQRFHKDLSKYLNS